MIFFYNSCTRVIFDAGHTPLNHEQISASVSSSLSPVDIMWFDEHRPEYCDDVTKRLIARDIYGTPITHHTRSETGWPPLQEWWHHSMVKRKYQWTSCLSNQISPGNSLSKQVICICEGNELPPVSGLADIRPANKICALQAQVPGIFIPQCWVLFVQVRLTRHHS